MTLEARTSYKRKPDFAMVRGFLVGLVPCDMLWKSLEFRRLHKALGTAMWRRTLKI